MSGGEVANIQQVIDIMRTQFGKPWQFAVPQTITDPDPPAFDCSGLIFWASGRAGASPPVSRTSFTIHRQCIDTGTLMGDVRTNPGVVAAAIGTFGALLIRSLDTSGAPCDPEAGVTGHIVVSLGNGRVIESMGNGRPVGEYGANPQFRVWTAAGLIPGVDYSVAPPPGLPGNSHPRARPYLMNDSRTEARNYRGADRRDWVRRLQQLLIEAGHLPIPAPTGNFRGQTQAAVIGFQQRVATHHAPGFAVDAECGKLTWGWLLYLTGHGFEE